MERPGKAEKALITELWRALPRRRSDELAAVCDWYGHCLFYELGLDLGRNWEFRFEVRSVWAGRFQRQISVLLFASGAVVQGSHEGVDPPKVRGRSGG